MEDGMSEGELDGLRRAVERLMDGQREALEVLRRALDGEAPAEEALEELEDVLQGALDDARAILGTEEEGDEA
jgi:hypothetical protein